MVGVCICSDDEEVMSTLHGFTFLEHGAQLSNYIIL